MFIYVCIHYIHTILHIYLTSCKIPSFPGLSADSSSSRWLRFSFPFCPSPLPLPSLSTTAFLPPPVPPLLLPSPSTSPPPPLSVSTLRFLSLSLLGPSRGPSSSARPPLPPPPSSSSSMGTTEEYSLSSAPSTGRTESNGTSTLLRSCKYPSISLKLCYTYTHIHTYIHTNEKNTSKIYAFITALNVQ